MTEVISRTRIQSLDHNSTEGQLAIAAYRNVASALSTTKENGFTLNVVQRKGTAGQKPYADVYLVEYTRSRANKRKS
jgi:hypothetical protein